MDGRAGPTTTACAEGDRADAPSATGASRSPRRVRRRAPLAGGRGSAVSRGRGTSLDNSCTRTQGRGGCHCSWKSLSGRRNLPWQYAKHGITTVFRRSHRSATMLTNRTGAGWWARPRPLVGYLLSIPCGSSTYLRAAPLSKSRYPLGAWSSGRTVAFTFFAICVRSFRIAIMSCRL